MNLTLTMKSEIGFFPSNFGSCYISVITYFSENHLAPRKQSIRKELICVKPQTREKYWGANFIRYIRQSSGKVGKHIKKLSLSCRCSCGAAPEPGEHPCHRKASGKGALAIAGLDTKFMLCLKRSDSSPCTQSRSQTPFLAA